MAPFQIIRGILSRQDLCASLAAGQCHRGYARTLDRLSWAAGQDFYHWLGAQLFINIDNCIPGANPPFLLAHRTNLLLLPNAEFRPFSGPIVVRMILFY